MKANSRVLVGIVLGTMLGWLAFVGLELFFDAVQIRNMMALTIFMLILPYLIASVACLRCIRGFKRIGFPLQIAVLVAIVLGALANLTLATMGGMLQPPTWWFSLGPTVTALLTALAAIVLPGHTKRDDA